VYHSLLLPGRGQSQKVCRARRGKETRFRAGDAGLPSTSSRHSLQSWPTKTRSGNAPIPMYSSTATLETLKTSASRFERTLKTVPIQQASSPTRSYLRYGQPRC
jgi:hypothetical protein